MKIVITGSIAYDYIMRYPGEFKEMLLEEKLDHISVSFLVDELTKQRGGVAANIAYTLALLGETPLLVGTVGQDFSEYGASLASVGVDVSGVKTEEDLFTASFFVSTDNNNNQIASFYSGAMSRAQNLSIADADGKDADLVIISPNDPTAMENYVIECKQNGIPYLYDPSQQVARVNGEVLATGVDGAHILVVNEYEHAALCKKTGFTHDMLLSKVPNVIVTRGKHGADIYTENNVLHIPIAPADNIIDPTGVGDGFRSGLLKGIAQSWGWEIAGRAGALAATYVLEQPGPQTHSFTPVDFVARFREHFDDDGRLDTMLG